LVINHFHVIHQQLGKVIVYVCLQFETENIMWCSGTDILIQALWRTKEAKVWHSAERLLPVQRNAFSPSYISWWL